MGLELPAAFDSGLFHYQQIDPAELLPGEFAALVRKSVETDGARLVVIDSLNGYLNAMPDERFLTLQMHGLLSYLAQQGVLTIVVLTQHGLVGATMDTPLDISYLSDAVLMLRYFEDVGTVRRTLSVVKKRSGNHEYTIRNPEGVKLGPPLTNFSGIFAGIPEYSGDAKPLMAAETSRHRAMPGLRVLATRRLIATPRPLARVVIETAVCLDLPALLEAAKAGAVAVFVAEEALFGKDLSRLEGWVAV